MKFIRTTLLFIIAFATWVPVVHAGEILRVDYEGFSVWVDCDRRGAVVFRYNAQRDTGQHSRVRNFHLDKQVPARCQQKATHTYRAPGQRYDRGHMTPANHLDYSKKAIRQSNYMTNVWPQAANMNRGSWLLTEEIVECYRDIDELLVLGGPIWTGDSSNDYFMDSHGIETPEAFWKVIVRGDRVIAWIIPNKQSATRKRLDNYLVTVSDVESAAGLKVPVPGHLKSQKPEQSWYIPRGCNKG